MRKFILWTIVLVGAFVIGQAAFGQTLDIEAAAIVDEKQLDTMNEIKAYGATYQHPMVVASVAHPVVSFGSIDDMGYAALGTRINAQNTYLQGQIGFMEGAGLIYRLSAGYVPNILGAQIGYIAHREGGDDRTITVGLVARF